MKFRVRPKVSFAWAVLGCMAVGTNPARASLPDYVTRPEPEFAWQLKGKSTSGDTTIYDLHLTSQVWQGIKWQHDLQIYQPKGAEPTSTLFLWNTGGKPNPGDAFLARDLARKMKAPCAFLYGVPNQPLLDGKKEDA